MVCQLRHIYNNHVTLGQIWLQLFMSKVRTPLSPNSVMLQNAIEYHPTHVMVGKGCGNTNVEHHSYVV